MNQNVLSIWTIYEKPLDFPLLYVARRFEIMRDGPRPTEDVITSRDIELVRRALSLRGLTPLPREEGERVQIVESWI